MENIRNNQLMYFKEVEVKVELKQREENKIR